MTSLLYLLFSAHALLLQPAPEGTQLNVRLTSAVGSFASKPGAPISGVVIAPVVVDGRTLIPAGTLVAGKVKSVTRVGFGVFHERAALRLVFDHLELPDGDPFPFSSQVIEVDNARERVTSNGLIQGIRSTGSISYRVSGYVRTALLWDVHAEMAEWAIKSLLVQLPEPEIYYPPGTELALKLTKPLVVPNPLDTDNDPGQLAQNDLQDLRALISHMPLRTQDPETDRASDPTNVLLIGNRAEISQAFQAAGWMEAQPDNIRTRIQCIRAAAESRGFSGAPMSTLLLNGADPDMSWVKSLNDLSKRHHIRIWKQPGLWYGQELWIAAATQDIDFAYMRPGRPFTHEIHPRIDQERDKVVNDLAFTSCARPIDLAQRANLPRLTRNATGDPIGTDGRMAVVELTGCPSPQLASTTQDGPELRSRGNKWHRFARREIIITRNDFLRTNIYYRSYEASRWAVNYVRYRRRKASEFRTLRAEFGPPGSSKPETKQRTSGLALQTLR